MAGGERRKGLVDGMMNCSLGEVDLEESLSYLDDVTGMALVANERQLEKYLPKC